MPKIQIYSSRAVEQHMQQINDCIGNPNQDSFFFLSKKKLFSINKIKRIRSLSIFCHNQYDEEFFQSIRLITTSMQNQIKDLRS